MFIKQMNYNVQCHAQSLVSNTNTWNMFILNILCTNAKCRLKAHLHSSHSDCLFIGRQYCECFLQVLSTKSREEP